MRHSLVLRAALLCAVAHPAAAQVANTYCAQNPAACAPVTSAYGGGYGAVYGAPAYGAAYGVPSYGAGYGGAYGVPAYGAGYGGYPAPGYYGGGGLAQANSLNTIANGPRYQPGQDGQQPFPPVTAEQTAAPAPPHPANADFNRYSANVFGDANRATKVVQRTARSAGIQDGFNEESRRIAAYLDTPEISERLERRFAFAEVMIGPDIVPPVVSELRGVRQTPNRALLVTTIGSFEILRQARVAVMPPNWRDYLTVVPPPESRTTWTPPRGEVEQANWDAGYEGGLEVGVAQARAAFDDSLARLDRDYAGMRRYHELAAQGAVSMPRVAQRVTRQKVSPDGQSAAIEQRSLQIVVRPQFQRTASAVGPE